MVKLEDLQMAEYDILCFFADFCKKNKIEYMLYGGTLLGAIRHNGFVPWDDDIDVLMSYKDYSNFLELFRKEKNDNYFLSCYKTERECPYHFAKLRKNGTLMEEYSYRGLNINNGVWIDIFCYVNKPNSGHLINLQEKLLGIFQMLGEKYLLKQKIERQQIIKQLTKIQKIFLKTPDYLILLVRSFLLFIAAHLAGNNSHNVRFFDYNGNHNICVKRQWIAKVKEHKFVDKMFNVPQEYAKVLEMTYGKDYMIPKKTHEHIVLNKVKL